MHTTAVSTEATPLKNPLAEPEERWPAPDPSVWIFHRRMPAYRATTLYYTTIFLEIEQALAAAGIEAPDVVVVPMGVGAFMSAAFSYYRSRSWKGALVGVEPADANCIQVSARAGKMIAVPGPHRSIMVGLNCGLPSPVAWPRVSTGVDWMVSIGDERAREGMRSLAGSGVVAGETGAAALGALAALAEDSSTADFRDAGLLGPDKTIFLMITEGATDRGNYQAVVGRTPEEIGTLLTVAR